MQHRGDHGQRSAHAWSALLNLRPGEPGTSAFSSDVALSASVLATTLHGRIAAEAFCTAMDELCEWVTCTSETRDGASTFLQWDAAAFQDRIFSGLTVLKRDGEGLVCTADVFQKPSKMVVRLAFALADRLAASLGDDLSGPF
jgi:hypothetical protein